MELQKLLEANSKHGSYQMLPPALCKIKPGLKKYDYSFRLDDKRYEWFTNKLDFNQKKVIDIGANIGYFSFRLCTEYKSQVIAYEPFLSHHNAMLEIQKELKILEDGFKSINQGISLHDISKLPEQDIILLFNVLQHAGEDYDSNLVNNATQWYDYAIEYLQKISDKAEFIVYQMGYSWLGHEEHFCKPEQIINFTKKLFADAKLEIVHFGIIKNVISPEYKDIKLKDDSNTHPILKYRKEITLELFRKVKISKNNFRFMQRPILIFRKKKN